MPGVDPLYAQIVVSNLWVVLKVHYSLLVRIVLVVKNVFAGAQSVKSVARLRAEHEELNCFENSVKLWVAFSKSAVTVASFRTPLN